ncbi:O-antigen ligase family protein [Hansschlegelia zhihuaiae]|uniref:O-antigen ligase domain-containing protein n=1 Tax=Hansschlegelia zhihuaiae TaxID=405005 RepID=A0A4V1KIJ8_9HYPH|nr:O-antigen ligase family protein [Hansschlegelia zhihuaiae]RXF70942.1 O-antigen ligase domain-containing protein [Hansschlegelia zhihuaiae]
MEGALAVGANWALTEASAGRRLKRDRPDLHDRYVGLLFFTLVGYATLGKGFAYLGVPPLFIGEIVLILGLASLLVSGCWIAIATSLPNLLLLTLMVWVMARTLPYVREYGIDAPRDSMIVMYGLFALIVTGLLVEKPTSLIRTLTSYSRFAWFFGWAGGPIYHLTNPGFLTVVVPFQLPQVRAGEAGVHLAGAAVFMLLGLGRASRTWWLLLLASVVMVVPSRAAMLSCLVPLALAVILGGKIRRVLPGLAAGGALLAVAYAANLEVELPLGRSVGPAQMVDNVASLFGRSDASNLDGTKTWRLRWWEAIRNYTLHGDYFWTGKGFGVNLAESDGFLLEKGASSLRSPHNGHMSILARAGVPGLILWIATGVAWYVVLGAAIVRARRQGLERWACVFIWLICYASGALINASFDVALEGPMLGIWFWSIFGLGIGAVMVFDAQLALPSRRHRSRQTAREQPKRHHDTSDLINLV